MSSSTHPLVALFTGDVMEALVLGDLSPSEDCTLVSITVILVFKVFSSLRINKCVSSAGSASFTFTSLQFLLIGLAWCPSHFI